MTPGQRSWGGVTFGGYNDPVQIVSEDGLENLLVRSASSALPRYHGSIPGDHTADQKRVILQLWWQGATPAEAEELAVLMRSIFSVSREVQQPYGFQHSFGPEGFVQARVVRRSSPRSLRTETLATYFMAVELEVTDPALYSVEMVGGILAPFTVASGFSWDAVWPISWGAGGTGGGAIINNTGEWETWPTFFVYGPDTSFLTNPIIENVTSGERLALNANGGVVISSGQILIISTHPSDRYVRFTTGASRYGKLSPDSVFFPLIPGPNELRFRASGTTTGATVDVEAHSAWL